MASQKLTQASILSGGVSSTLGYADEYTAKHHFVPATLL